jgi:hypothetical protein
MDNFITSFVGLDVHKDSIAIAVAEAGRDEPRFLGTASPQGTALHQALAKLGKPATLMIVYLVATVCGGICRHGAIPARSLHPRRSPGHPGIG